MCQVNVSAITSCLKTFFVKIEYPDRELLNLFLAAPSLVFHLVCITEVDILTGYQFVY